MAQNEVTEPVAQVADSSGAVTEEKGQEEQKKDFVAYDTYRRAVGEVKALKAKLNELLAQKEAEEQQRLAEQGRWKEKAELLEKTLREKDERLNNVVSTFARRVFEESVKQVAQDVGVRKEAVQDVLRVADFSDIEVTEDFTVNQQQLKAKLEALAKEKPWFFEQKKPQVPSATPFVTDASMVGTKKLEDLSWDELRALAKSIKE
ncbi:MAG: hypothetical protein WHU54_09210 [Candidatus Bathyarchaeia archaeon]